MKSSPRLVYALLTVAWAAVIAWQAWEHHEVKSSAKAALVNRSVDITTTLELVIRSQRRFGGMVAQDRLESALKELVKSGEVISLALLNVSGDIVASAGAPIAIQKKGVIQSSEKWEANTLTVASLIDLGATPAREGEASQPTIVLPKGENPRPPWEDRNRSRTNSSGERQTNFNSGSNEKTETNASFLGPPPNWPGPPGRRGPPRMDPKQLQSLIESRGLHGLIVALSTEPILIAIQRDIWTRCIIGLLGTVSAIGLGLAWRNLGRSSELQIRLLRASELNAHLKEMNLAAAGLAHETRNPLNIIRGLAQLIRNKGDAPPEIATRCGEIINETDRVASQLNEFINYSRPREVRATRVMIQSVIGEVARALTYDLEEKQLDLKTSIEPIAIEADEQLLRQLIFNLLLNSIQAVKPTGRIEIEVIPENNFELALEVRDNGPGVNIEHRLEIFKPYFTTHQKGTGLGLAVVQQIVSAHGWEIAYHDNLPNGAVFRITHIKPARS